MIPTIPSYQEAMEKPIRTATLVKIEYGVPNESQPLKDYHNPYAVWTGSGFLNSTYDGYQPTTNYAYYYDGYFKTNGSHKFLSENEEDNVRDCGFLISAVALYNQDEHGYIFINNHTGEQDVYYEFKYTDSNSPEPKSLNGFILTFDRLSGTYPTYLRVEIKNGEDVVYNEYFDNDSNTFIFEEEIAEMTNIFIYVLNLNKAKTILKLDKMFTGTGETYTEKDLDQTGFTLERSISLLSNELSYNELSFTVNNIEKKYNPFELTGIYKNFSKSQPVTLYVGREVEGEPYYLEVANLLTSEISFDENTFTIKCIDVLNTLNQVNYYTKYNTLAITETWKEMIHEVLYNINSDITDDDIIFTDKIANTNATSQGFAVPTKELFQLIANINNSLVMTNRFGLIEFVDAWTPMVTVTDNGHYELSDVQAAFDTVDLPTESYNQYTTDFQMTKDESGILFAPDTLAGLKLLGYVGSEIADTEGVFANYPTITVSYSLSTDIDSLYLVFDHLRQEYPTEFSVEYFDSSGSSIFLKEYIDNTYFEVSDDIDVPNCSKYIITMKKWSVAEHRPVVNRIGDGRISDYYLDFNNIKAKPSVTKLNYVKEINSKYHTYKESDQGVQDVYQATIYGNGRKSLYSDEPFWYTSIEKVSGTGTIDAYYNSYSNAVHFDVSGNTDGMVVAFKGIPVDDTSLSYLSVYGSEGDSYSIDNPFCTTPELAARMNMWYYDYVEKGQKLTISYRGDPVLEPFDFIYVQTQFQDKIPCVITKTTLDYNGSLSGTLEVIAV